MRIDPLYLKVLQDSNKNLTEIVNNCVDVLKKYVASEGSMSEEKAFREMIKVLEEKEVLRRLSIAETLNNHDLAKQGQ